MKTFLKILLIAALAAVLLFAAGRYGWRAFGFAACDEPNMNYAQNVTLEGGAVRIAGGTASSFSSYVGSIHKIEDGRLYVGIKHNGFLGFFQRIGGFAIAIPTEGQAVTAVYFKGGNDERLVWTREDGVIRNTPASNPQGKAADDDSAPADEDIVQASYPYDGVDGENDLCAVLFLGYDEASANDAVTRLCGEYEVVHEMFLNGEVVAFDAHGGEQYLILPKYAGTTITVTEAQMDENGELQPVGEPRTTEAPLRVLANYSDIMPSTKITVQYGSRSVTFSPFISLKDGVLSEIDGAYTLMMQE